VGSRRSAESLGFSRPTIYAASGVASEVLREHFEATGSERVPVDVDEAHLRRAVVALRVVSPNALRPIEDLLPILYPHGGACGPNWAKTRSARLSSSREDGVRSCNPTKKLTKTPPSTPFPDDPCGSLGNGNAYLSGGYIMRDIVS